MIRLLFSVLLITLNMLYSYSQEQQSILNKAVQSYQQELPNMQKTIFKKFCQLYKQGQVYKNDIGKYQIIVVPTFKLNKNFIQYKNGDVFARYIDFESMWNNYYGYIFKDGSYIGYLFFDKGFSYFDVNIDKDLAKQIRDFRPDMIFHPDGGELLCCIKDGKFYMAEMIKASECEFLTQEEFIKQYPTLIEKLSKFGFPALKRYKEIK